MATQKRSGIFLYVALFLFGIVAGSGIGFVYGGQTANLDLERRLAVAENQLETVNANHIILIREYNKLFNLRAGSLPPTTVALPAAPARPVEPQGPEWTADPRLPEEEVAPEAEAPAAADADAEAVTEEDAAEDGAAEAEVDAETATTAPPVAGFEGIAVGGTGPQAGPPPQPFRFTDLSTGEITSWEWDFGDGNTSTEQNPNHTVLKCPGVQELCTVTLTVCGPGGCDTETKLDYLWVSESCTGC